MKKETTYYFSSRSGIYEEPNAKSITELISILRKSLENHEIDGSMFTENNSKVHIVSITSEGNKLMDFKNHTIEVPELKGLIEKGKLSAFIIGKIERLLGQRSYREAKDLFEANISMLPEGSVKKLKAIFATTDVLNLLKNEDKNPK